MYYKTTALILTSVGAINWGLVGVADFNLVNYILGSAPLVEKIVYAVVGISGIYSLYACWGKCSSKK